MWRLTRSIMGSLDFGSPNLCTVSVAGSLVRRTSNTTQTCFRRGPTHTAITADSGMQVLDLIQAGRQACDQPGRSMHAHTHPQTDSQAGMHVGRGEVAWAQTHCMHRQAGPLTLLDSHAP